LLFGPLLFFEEIGDEKAADGYLILLGLVFRHLRFLQRPHKYLY